MDSHYTDPELINWPRWASERCNPLTYVRTVSEEARMGLQDAVRNQEIEDEMNNHPKQLTKVVFLYANHLTNLAD